MEQPDLAEAVWLLRSWAEPDCAESADGPAGSAAIRGGVCFVSRDAACEASDAAVGVQFDFAFAAIPRGGKAVRAVPGGAEISGSARAVGGVAAAFRRG